MPANLDTGKQSKCTVDSMKGEFTDSNQMSSDNKPEWGKEYTSSKKEVLSA